MSIAYTIDDTRKKQFAGVYLLEYMATQKKTFSLLLPRDEEPLEEILEWLLIRDYVNIIDESHYAVATAGLNELKEFASRYVNYLTHFDIYSAVDLEAGEFAFSSYFSFETEDAWKIFLEDERWEDLRIAVAEHRGMDPVAIVFMNFLQEKRFGRDQSGWQFDLLLGSVWDEILDISTSALHASELGFDSDEGPVSGETVIEDIIDQAEAELERLLEEETPPPLPAKSGWKAIAGNENGSVPPPLPEDTPPPLSL
ncbi:MAG: hypothetical protein ACI8T1_003575 [Verrucomicrobiales bacterium]|jgi:hypothetical protein